MELISRGGMEMAGLGCMTAGRADPEEMAWLPWSDGSGYVRAMSDEA